MLASTSSSGPKPTVAHSLDRIPARRSSTEVRRRTARTEPETSSRLATVRPTFGIIDELKEKRFVWATLYQPLPHTFEAQRPAQRPHFLCRCTRLYSRAPIEDCESLSKQHDFTTRKRSEWIQALENDLKGFDHRLDVPASNRSSQSGLNRVPRHK